MFSAELKLTENRLYPPLRLMTLEDAKVALSCDVSRENKKRTVTFMGQKNVTVMRRWFSRSNTGN